MGFVGGSGSGLGSEMSGKRWEPMWDGADGSVGERVPVGTSGKYPPPTEPSRVWGLSSRGDTSAFVAAGYASPLGIGDGPGDG